MRPGQLTSQVKDSTVIGEIVTERNRAGNYGHRAPRITRHAGKFRKAFLDRTVFGR
ncbi:hypothetical protein SAMN05660473_00494 [Arthrobacter sp. 49Tsu3.1M3]|jgi:hypothetical protein|nr:hypothetical protein SAMN05660473_00494 [Arthrobacter sp. 49Tsu3.1M3]